MRCPRCTHESKFALSPLGAGAARELLDELLGSHGALNELAASILERTGGNPFFTEEVVQALVGAGNLVGERGAYRLAAPVEALTLPVTVQALLAQLHAAVAAALEKLHADRLGEHASLIAHRWEASGMRFEASRWKRRAVLKVANIKIGQRGRRPRS